MTLNNFSQILEGSQYVTESIRISTNQEISYQVSQLDSARTNVTVALVESAMARAYLTVSMSRPPVTGIRRACFGGFLQYVKLETARSCLE